MRLSRPIPKLARILCVMAMSSPLAAVAATTHDHFPASEKFSSSDAAAKHCPNDTVVWATFSKSKAFHLSGSKYFGKTKHGAYVCKKDAHAAGYHQSKR